VIIDVMTGTDGEAFEAVLVSWSWWDCPRAGVALMDGQYYYFDCEFSEELDDYPSEFRLWPISGDDLADQLEAWELFAAWRGRADSGLRPPPFPGVPRPAVLDRTRDYARRQPPPDARVAIPEWRLDCNRSFAGRVPGHLVRWTFVG
jgi:hypothetical protein